MNLGKDLATPHIVCQSGGYVFKCSSPPSSCISGKQTPTNPAKELHATAPVESKMRRTLPIPILGRTKQSTTMGPDLCLLGCQVDLAKYFPQIKNFCRKGHGCCSQRRKLGTENVDCTAMFGFARNRCNVDHDTCTDWQPANTCGCFFFRS